MLKTPFMGHYRSSHSGVLDESQAFGGISLSTVKLTDQSIWLFCMFPRLPSVGLCECHGKAVAEDLAGRGGGGWL